MPKVSTKLTNLCCISNDPPRWVVFFAYGAGQLVIFTGILIRLVNYDKTSVNIKIYNMLGREMLRYSSIEITDDEQNYYMNLETLSSGIYIIKVEQGEYNTSLRLEKR